MRFWPPSVCTIQMPVMSPVRIVLGRKGQKIHTDDNLRAAQVHALETILVPNTFLGLLLHLVGVLDHGESLVDVEVGLVRGGEAEEISASGGAVALADVPPWRSARHMLAYDR